MFDVSIGNLPNLYYNMNCSLEHDFKRGVDTNMIIKVLQAYIKDNYPYIKYLQFSDASNRECDDGQFIDLAAMSYFTTGQTWYEKHFHAVLTHESDEIFKKAVAGMNEKKSKLLWDDIKPIIKADYPLSEDTLKQLFEKSKTWVEFFGEIRDKIGVPKFCVFAAPWFSMFMSIFLKMNIINLKYNMPIHFKVSYTLLPYTSGGKRFTRKTLRPRAPRNET